ncbi:hypothetical protein LCGC14_0826760 [marine sediment metagenome]|uniref:DNA (cytosine-5-)-methyltransferase n=1 Tax=marine sediment metagenome TaxID=412755 RepID=A0A0F9Q2F3_9ZZZZ
MKELSLFSGAGGGLLGTHHLLGWNTIGYVEYDDYCQRVIAQRIKDGLLDEAPIFGDIRTFTDSGCAELYRGVTDVITAGFPCQPFSVAGKREGEQDSRNLWPETAAVIRLVRPAYAFLENVPGLLVSGYMPTIFGDLAEAGYDARWCVLGADDVGANHRRKRLWILAYSESTRRRPNNTQGCRMEGNGNGLQQKRKKDSSRLRVSGQEMVNSARIQQGRQEQRTKRKRTGTRGKSCAAEEPARAELYENESGKPWRRRPSGEECKIPRVPIPDPILKHDDRCGHGASEICGQRQKTPELQRSGNWLVEPALGRVAHGVANRVDRLKAIGNGQVPQVAATAWEILKPLHPPPRHITTLTAVMGQIVDKVRG